MRNEKYITHNVSLFKPVKVDPTEQSKNNEDGGDDDLSSENKITQNPNSPQSNANQTTRYPMRERRPLQRYIEHYRQFKVLFVMIFLILY